MSIFIPMTAGALAGVSVDLALYPIDTIKTRMQSRLGFRAAGGFRGIYSGVSVVGIGSAPGAALFFTTYDTVQSGLSHISLPWLPNPSKHMLAAALGEIVACLVRVPCEVVKQRRQVQTHTSVFNIARNVLLTEGAGGLYRGYKSTILREIPFSVIQFPLWEWIKSILRKRHTTADSPLSTSEAIFSGFVAGGVSAAITTPLDVAKTRIMLAEVGSPLASGRILFALRHIFHEKGIRGLFAGIAPRVALISVGGAIFLGVYERFGVTLKDIFSVSR